jgi:hypothetical protein
MHCGAPEKFAPVYPGQQRPKVLQNTKPFRLANCTWNTVTLRLKSLYSVFE